MAITKRPLRLFDNALALKPDYERAQYALGVALKREGQNEAAAAELQSVSKQHQQPAFRDQVHKLLGDGAQFEPEGKPEQAKNAYQHALDLVPDSAAAHMALGILYARSGDPAQAAGELRQATLSDPDAAGTRSS